MRYQRVLFVIPDLKGFHTGKTHPYTGVGFLATALEQKGVECDIVDAYLGYQLSDIKERIRTFNPDLIGVTTFTFGHSIAYQLVAHLKELTSVNVIIGGPHVSLYGSKSFEESRANLALRYEGEYSLSDLCEGRPLEEIAGLIYVRDGQIVENPNHFIQDLDALSFPTYHGFELDKYAPGLRAIVSSRGCPWMCTYCSVSTTMGRKYRFRSPANIVREIEYWYEKGYRLFDFFDDTFAQKSERIYKLCDLIEEKNFKSIRFGCSQGIRPNTVDRQLLTRMREIGFDHLGFGVESANDNILKNIKKGQTVKQVDEAIRVACELGFDVSLFFMIGLPGETMAEVQNSFALATKYPIRRANFYNVIPYPGTELYTYLERNKLFVVDPEVYLNDVNTRISVPMFYTPSLSIAERKEALRQAKKISLKVYRAYKERQLKHLGIIGRMAAWFLSVELISGWIEKALRADSVFARLLLSINEKIVAFAPSQDDR